MQGRTNGERRSRDPSETCERLDRDLAAPFLDQNAGLKPEVAGDVTARINDLAQLGGVATQPLPAVHIK